MPSMPEVTATDPPPANTLTQHYRRGKCQTDYLAQNAVFSKQNHGHIEIIYHKGTGFVGTAYLYLKWFVQVDKKIYIYTLSKGMRNAVVKNEIIEVYIIIETRK